MRFHPIGFSILIVIHIRSVIYPWFSSIMILDVSVIIYAQPAGRNEIKFLALQLSVHKRTMILPANLLQCSVIVAPLSSLFVPGNHRLFFSFFSLKNKNLCIFAWNWHQLVVYLFSYNLLSRNLSTITTHNGQWKASSKHLQWTKHILHYLFLCSMYHVFCWNVLHSSLNSRAAVQFVVHVTPLILHFIDIVNLICKKSIAF